MTKRNLGGIGAALLLALPALSVAQTYTPPDYSTAVTGARDSIQTQLTTNAPAIMTVLALGIGISLIFKLVRKGAR